jgi:hypothetical protein
LANWKSALVIDNIQHPPSETKEGFRGIPTILPHDVFGAANVRILLAFWHIVPAHVPSATGILKAEFLWRTSAERVSLSTPAFPWKPFKNSI